MFQSHEPAPFNTSKQRRDKDVPCSPSARRRRSFDCHLRHLLLTQRRRRRRRRCRAARYSSSRMIPRRAVCRSGRLARIPRRWTSTSTRPECTRTHHVRVARLCCDTFPCMVLQLDDQHKTSRRRHTRNSCAVKTLKEYICQENPRGNPENA